ncbi:hypothetical protein NLM31_36870 [Bradyrhizobium sp. CCGUVB4N]|uniref:calcium-binding protein n=1 Tax=Bradyrhizobium sp. CCGUVB4N TaxID=2949631 RepID=UPI0020B44BDB|nr:calcium-binding protein [Bradyrhizobium sp. CCGUVB4N]MCP3385976.1 hypothetical protein [Bradyrhizobium sp. CCGUVB4N]
MSNPSLADYLEASDATYFRTTPSDLTPLLGSNGQPVVSDPSLLGHGFYAEAFEDSSGNIIVAFEGTVLPGSSAASLAGNSYIAGETGADAAIALGQIPQAFTDAANFMQTVELAAAFHNIPTSKIFVTGHSLGGAEAEAASVGVAGITFGGVTFGAPGVAISGTDPNLTDYVDYGDPVGNFGTDTKAGATYTQPSIKHIGQVEMTGTVASGAALVKEGIVYTDLKSTLSSPFLLGALGVETRALLAAGLSADLAVVAVAQLPFHDLEANYAPDLGYSLDNTTGNATQNGTVGPLAAAKAGSDLIASDFPYSSYTDVLSSSGSLQQLTVNDTDGSSDVVDFDLTGGSSLITDNTYNASNQLVDTIQVNTDDSETDTFYNLNGGLLADQAFNYDSSGKLASVVVAFTNGNSITLDTGTYTGLSWNSSSNTLSATLTASNGQPLGNLVLNASGGGTVTLASGEVFTLPSSSSAHVAAVAAGTSNLQVLADYLTNLGVSLTASQLSADNDAYLNPAQTPTTINGTVTKIDDSSATDTFYSGGDNAIVTGATSVDITDYDTNHNGYIVSVTPTNIFEAAGDISLDTISNIQELQILNDTLHGGVKLTADQFNSFGEIAVSPDGASIVNVIIEGGGTVSLLSSNVDPNAAFYGLTAEGWEGTTLIGNNESYQYLQASEFGNDMLQAGNGTNDTLYAGEGVDTLIGGTGGDTFYADSGLAAGSSIEGNGTGNILATSGDITGATITGVQTLYALSGAVLNMAELNEFSTVNGTFAISDTASNIVANLATLEGFAAGDQLTAIALTDSSVPSISLTAGQVVANLDAIDAISSAYSLSVSDTAANVTANLSVLEALAANGDLASITLTDSGTPTLSLTATQFSSDSTALGTIGSAYNLFVSGVSAENAEFVASDANVSGITVSDTAENVQANIAVLETLVGAGELTSIALTDTGVPSMTLTAAEATSSALNAITSAYHLTVSDSSANVVANLSGLETLATSGKLTSVALTDGGTPAFTLTGAQLSADFGVLALISGAYTVSVTDGDGTGQTLSIADSSANYALDIQDTLSSNTGSNYNNTLDASYSSGTNTLTVGDGSYDLIRTDYSTGTNALTAGNGGNDYLDAEHSQGANGLSVGSGSSNTLDVSYSSGNNTLQTLTGSSDYLNAEYSTGNDTLTTGSGNSNVLDARNSTGADTISTGNGNNDTVYAGLGVDTITTGTGTGNTIIAYNGLAAGSSVTANSSDARLDVNGDISGAAISGIRSLDSTTGVTLTAAELNGIGVIEANTAIYAATGGTYSINGKGNSGDSLHATANTGTTLSGTASGISLYASASGNDTLTAGNGTGETIYAGGGVDTITTGTGSGDIVYALSGLVSGSSVNMSATSTGTLVANGDITGATITGVHTIYSTTGVTLTASELSGFSLVQAGSILYAATGGTYSMSSGRGQAGDTLYATSNAGTTLIAGNAASNVLHASASGTDTLTMGTGAGDTAYAGGGVDTITLGAGSNDIVYALGGLASGSHVTAGSTSSTLNASGNISGATLSGIGTLEADGTSVSLTASQLSAFTAVKNTSGGASTLDATTAGTYSLAGKTVTGAVNLDASGSSANVTLTGGSGSLTMVAGTGNDTFNGGSGTNTYDFGASFGQDSINNAAGGATSAAGSINFTSGSVSDENLWFQQSGNNLVIDLLGTSDQITVDNWFGSNAGAEVAGITAGGLTLDSQVAQLVQAMATYAAANSGFNPATATSMPADTTLQNAIAASWHH